MLCFVDVALFGLRFPLNGRYDHARTVTTKRFSPRRGLLLSSAPDPTPSPARPPTRAAR